MKTQSLAIFIVLLVGCGHPTTYITSTNPGIYETPELKIVSFGQGKETTWNKILSLSYTSPFQTDMINMNAYQVKLRMEGYPEAYIDCGSKRIVTENQVTTVTNAASQYSYEAYRHRHLDTYNITNRFTGIANILVTGDQKSSQALIQFELKLNTLQHKTSTQGNLANKSSDFTLAFRPDEEVLNPFFGTICRSTGKFEKTFLDFMALLKQ